MSRLILRFQSLALREEGRTSTVHLEVEDDVSLVRSRATIVERGDGGLEVSPPSGVSGPFDREGFAQVVRGIFYEQLRMVERLGAAVPAFSCIVALNDAEVVLEAEAAAATG